MDVDLQKKNKLGQKLTDVTHRLADNAALHELKLNFDGAPIMQERVRHMADKFLVAWQKKKTLMI